MEVHTHTHTPRKKWTHYFWEFLMLFLAVTLGFFVENQREHYVEHLREKQFISSMIIDVKLDTNALNGILQRREDRLEMLDSLTLLLNSPERDKHASRIYYFGRHIQRLFSVSFTYNDRTIQQLKNAGNMRLIRSRAASDAIILYDARVRDMQITEARENEYMFQCLPYLYKIFNGLVFDKMLDSTTAINEPPEGVLLSATFSTSLPEFNGALHSVKSSNLANRNRVKMLIQDGENLLNILKREYHLN